MGYIVKWKHPGLGTWKSTSSVWGVREDAENYAAGKREAYPSEADSVEIFEVKSPPQIFPHCKDSISQAIGGLCFTCKEKLTYHHAKKFSEAEGRVVE